MKFAREANEQRSMPQESSHAAVDKNEIGTFRGLPKSIQLAYRRWFLLAADNAGALLDFGPRYCRLIAAAMDCSTICSFAVALAICATKDRSVAWLRRDFAGTETGIIYPPPLKELGLDPAWLALVRACNAVGVLKAGADAAGC